MDSEIPPSHAVRTTVHARHAVIEKPLYKLSELTTYELRDYRHALEQAIAASGSGHPGYPAQAVLQARLDAVIAEQDDRAQLARARPDPTNQTSTRSATA